MLSIDLFEKVIHEAKPLGLSKVKLTGGEPLLHPQFTKLLKMIRHQDLDVSIETNGLLCTAKIAHEIAKSPKRFVSVSIDGADAVTHEWVRGVSGSFKQVQKAVRNLAATNTPTQVIMSVMRCNVDQVNAVIKMAEKLGASSVKFNVVQPTARGEILHRNHEALGLEELIELGRYVDMELAHITKLRLFLDYPLAFRPLSLFASGDCNVCGILGILGVISSGHYALCGIGEHVPELVFGEIEADRLEDIWQEESTLKQLREGLPFQLTGICGQCLMKHRCLGSCIAQNYYRSGSMWSSFWFCEQAKEAGLFPETRLLNPNA
jgi:SynChlorMet cassette radical SAM/SPASM protein ScmF